MKILDLIELLSLKYTEFGNVKVLIAKDQEGNAFNDLHYLNHYIASLENHVYEVSDPECDHGFGHFENVIVIWP